VTGNNRISIGAAWRPPVMPGAAPTAFCCRSVETVETVETFWPVDLREVVNLELKRV
jgi:hypothetical protein